MVCEFWCPPCGHEVTGLRTETKIWGIAGGNDGKSPYVNKNYSTIGLVIMKGDTFLLFTYVVELGLLLFEAENCLTNMSAFDKMQSPLPLPVPFPSLGYQLQASFFLSRG